MSIWNPDNIKDIAESVGVSTLHDDVLVTLSGDVEYRIYQVLEEALRFMRHSRRNTLTTQDVSLALRSLDLEPLYGYESTRPLRFGEASIGPGQPLFYVEDEEVDFEKLINAPLPKVPREISFTAHWLAVEGVQPSIPQNPSSVDARNQELLPKGPGANPNLAAISGNDNVVVKPQVKHILSKELQLYFEKICNALLDEGNDEYRIAALASLRTDPGLHQLVPYFVQYVAEKVTHNLKNLFILHQMMQLTSAMLDNPSLFVDPYVSAIIPSILTCLVAPRLGSSSNRLEHYPLRALAASLLGHIAQKYHKSSHTLRPRLVRSFLKNFLDPAKPFAVHYGAILGISAVGRQEAVRQLILPHLPDYGALLQEGLGAGSTTKEDAEMAIGAVLGALSTLEEDAKYLANGTAGQSADEARQQQLVDKVGDLLATRIVREARQELIQAIIDV